MRALEKLDQAYWDRRWREGKTGWDVGHASPAIVDFFEPIENKKASILIPGCGNAYEAEKLLQLGFENITLLDISPTAVQNLKEKFSQTKGIQIKQQDFFQYRQTHDYMIEQTFFCALPPNMRQSYVSHTQHLLPGGGQLVGLLFSENFQKPGPPFGGTVEEYQQLFASQFHIRKMLPTDLSIAPRKDHEVFIHMVAKKSKT